MFKKEFELDFDHEARTLYPGAIGTHENGWTITGEIHEDYYEWVNYFEASHPIHGKVKGCYETYIEADTKMAFEAFEKEFPANIWDYYDI
jgi:hypothetical protein